MARPKCDIQRQQTGLRLRPDVMREIKHLGIDLERPTNVLVEEALMDLLRKYKITEFSKAV